MEKLITLAVINDLLQVRLIENLLKGHPFGKLVYILPPFIISEDELDKLITSLIKFVKEIE